MDETVRSNLAQAIRDAFTFSGVHPNEEYIDSLISQVYDAVCQTHQAIDERSATGGPSKTVFPLSPGQGSWSNRFASTTEKHDPYVARPKARKPKQPKGPKLSRKHGDKPPRDLSNHKGFALNCQDDTQQSANEELESEDLSESLVENSSSYHADSAYTSKAMSSILYECAKVNLSIASYGLRMSTALATTKPDQIRRYADDLLECDYEQAIEVILRDNAFATGSGLQNRYNETIFWKIILKCAAMIDHTKLPSAKGPPDGFTMAEKVAAKKFMQDAGYGLSAENQRQCRIFWKNLFGMREAGIDKALYYRTKEFDSYCKGYPRTAGNSLVDAVLQWENHYRPHIEQLETRALRFAKGDLMRLYDLETPQVVERLQVENSSWDNATNEWAFTSEKERFKKMDLQTFSPEVLSTHGDGKFVSESARDKSLFVSLLPRDSSFLFVCSIVPVREGDILGTFAGKIRFSRDFNVTHGILGPVKDLWLDYSQVTGTMNQMMVVETGGSANVHLQWEIVQDDIGIENCSWRVSVKATLPIMLFEPFIRVAGRQEQYVLHSTPENAKSGFLECCEVDSAH